MLAEDRARLIKIDALYGLKLDRYISLPQVSLILNREQIFSPALKNKSPKRSSSVVKFPSISLILTYTTWRYFQLQSLTLWLMTFIAGRRRRSVKREKLRFRSSHGLTLSTQLNLVHPVSDANCLQTVQNLTSLYQHRFHERWRRITTSSCTLRNRGYPGVYRGKVYWNHTKGSINTMYRFCLRAVWQSPQAFMAMDISTESQTCTSFSRDKLKVELSRPDYEHFSVTDLPGIFRSTDSMRVTLDSVN